MGLRMEKAAHSRLTTVRPVVEEGRHALNNNFIFKRRNKSSSPLPFTLSLAVVKRLRVNS